MSHLHQVSTCFIAFLFIFVFLFSHLDAFHSSIHSTPTKKWKPFSKLIPSTVVGAKITLDGSTLTAFEEKIVPIVIQDVKATTIPDISQEVDTPIGHVQLSGTNIQILDFAMNGLAVTVAPKRGIFIVLQNGNIVMTMNWRYKQGGFPHISDSGTADIQVSIGVTMSLQISLDPEKLVPVVTMVDVSADIKNFNLKLHGGASWLYNVFINSFSSTIKNSIKDTIETKIPATVNQEVSAILTKISFILPLPAPLNTTHIAIDYGVSEVHFDEENFMSFGTRGTFFDMDKQIEPYPTAPLLLPDRITSQPLNIFISDYVFNSASYMFFAKQLFTFVVTNAMIPSSLPVKLNTLYFKYLLPELYQKYPNMDMQITLEASGAPKFVLSTKSGLDVLVDIEAQFEVITNNQTTPVATQEVFTFDLVAELDSSVSLFNSTTLGLNFTFVQSKFTLKDSQVGTIKVEWFDALLRWTLEYFLIPFVNQYGKTGIPIPTVQQFLLIQPSILYGDGYLAISSDFAIK